ncbi:MAG: hypothetical protein LUD29_06540, partial [Clostridia bacterium]|nr:hypothetical protein [Clostridia bacterium]
VDAALIAGAIVMAWLVSTRTQKNAVLEVPAENESLANSPLNNFTEYDPSNPDGDVEMGKSENDNQ